MAVFKSISGTELGRGYFESSSAAEAWIGLQLKKPYYLSHRAMYTIRFKEGTYVPPEIQNGNIGMDWVTVDDIRYLVYTMPAAYTYEIIDRSQEVIDENEAIEVRKTEIQQIKNASRFTPRII